MLFFRRIPLGLGLLSSPPNEAERLSVRLDVFLECLFERECKKRDEPKEEELKGEEPKGEEPEGRV